MLFLQLASVRQSALLKHPLWQVLQAPCELDSVPWRAICEVRQHRWHATGETLQAINAECCRWTASMLPIMLPFSCCLYTSHKTKLSCTQGAEICFWRLDGGVVAGYVIRLQVICR